MLILDTIRSFRASELNLFSTPPVDVPESLELTRPGRGNFDLYEDDLAPQGWILFPEGVSNRRSAAA